MVVDDNIAMEWARIPHFYYNYYVFQYATGYSAAIALSRRILREGAPAVKDYLGFLSGGCSKSPIDLLKGAGVDMTSPEPVNQALALFPPALGQAIAHTQRDRQELVEEICCRIGQVPVLLTQAHVYPAECRAILAGDLDYLLERATGASVYAAGEQIRQGYLQTAGGCRVGLCGCAYGQAAGQIDGIRQLSSVSVRIPHAVPGCADALLPQLLRDGFCSTLILSPPGNGKTTLLRECVRRLSDMGTRISLMDERGEIAAVQNRAPQFDVGANTDVMTGGQKAACCMMLLRAMRPDVLAFDEISAPEDIEAIRIAAGCGVALLATAHAQSVAALRHRALYRALLDEHIFRRAVCITRSDGERVYTVEDLT